MQFSVLGLPCISDPEMYTQYYVLALAFCALKKEIIMSLKSHDPEGVQGSEKFCI